MTTTKNEIDTNKPSLAKRFGRAAMHGLSSSALIFMAELTTFAACEQIRGDISETNNIFTMSGLAIFAGGALGLYGARGDALRGTLGYSLLVGVAIGLSFGVFSPAQSDIDREIAIESATVRVNDDTVCRALAGGKDYVAIIGNNGQRTVQIDCRPR